jgi:hypothetical protein
MVRVDEEMLEALRHYAETHGFPLVRADGSIDMSKTLRHKAGLGELKEAYHG